MTNKSFSLYFCDHNDVKKIYTHSHIIDLKRTQSYFFPVFWSPSFYSNFPSLFSLYCDNCWRDNNVYIYVFKLPHLIYFFFGVFLYIFSLFCYHHFIASFSLDCFAYYYPKKSPFTLLYIQNIDSKVLFTMYKNNNNNKHDITFSKVSAVV